MIYGLNQTALSFYSGATPAGGLVYCSLAGKQVVVVNSERIARELIDKRSHIYSDRPYLSNDDLSNSIGIAHNTSQLPYGPEWKTHFRRFQKVLKADAAKAHYASHLDHSRQFLVDIYKAPALWEENMRKMTAASIIKLTYGYEIVPENDPFCEPVVELLDRLRSRKSLFGFRVLLGKETLRDQESLQLVVATYPLLG
ncbi:hypothetical protein CONPUDRAFT_73661 [Coniophora puteana RWD-64-598 SS2]|uniref:Cytochrome P450 n=1 Tax=Coniophora puteana (strain RWD-64-598) TaxID=741705 RepID=A0A5M3MN84_CONPW|nr:uncharacterized protein CONPUDRAFT_73661 [Coniophora puteana RWD-64-598 SS2]EIW80563.1 hypothetical protein CONPUDRAFT_73661 [Coniophora puteana RWD-64-598 SS2]